MSLSDLTSLAVTGLLESGEFKERTKLTSSLACEGHQVLSGQSSR